MLNTQLIITVIKVALAVLPIVAGVLLITRKREAMAERWRRSMLREAGLRIETLMWILRGAGVVLILIGLWIGWLLFGPSE
jgi:hypothetical protein